MFITPLPQDLDRRPEFRSLTRGADGFSDAEAAGVMWVLFRELFYLHQRDPLNPGLVTPEYLDFLIDELNRWTRRDWDRERWLSVLVDERRPSVLKQVDEGWNCPLFFEQQRENHSLINGPGFGLVGRATHRLASMARRLDKSPGLALFIDPKLFVVEEESEDGKVVTREMTDIERQNAVWLIRAVDHLLGHPIRENDAFTKSLVADAHYAMNRYGKEPCYAQLAMLAKMQLLHPQVFTGKRTETLLAEWDGWLEKVNKMQELNPKVNWTRHAYPQPRRARKRHDGAQVDGAPLELVTVSGKGRAKKAQEAGNMV